LPPELEVAPDQLKIRLDFYETTVVAHFCDNGVISTRIVSARDVAMALLGETNLISGLLPRETLCWGPGQVALWVEPRVWPVALMTEPFKPPRRMRLPMPGLIFICRPGQPPRVYAAKRRPRDMQAIIYHAPLFNVYRDGSTCPGTNKYPDKMEEIPKSFFISFFSPAAETRNRSTKYPNNLLKLWEELDGKTKYPYDDLVPICRLQDIFGKRSDLSNGLVEDLPVYEAEPPVNETGDEE
jgi:PRTRC genetic system protein B